MPLELGFNRSHIAVGFGGRCDARRDAAPELPPAAGKASCRHRDDNAQLEEGYEVQAVA